MVKELGVSFTAEMVKALIRPAPKTLEDYCVKIQTRRVSKVQPIIASTPSNAMSWFVMDADKKITYSWDVDRPVPAEFIEEFAPCKVGDRFYVREAYRADASLNDLKPSMIPDGAPLRFEADGTCVNDPTPQNTVEWGRYRHARFMPKRFARIWREITNVRAEFVQEISMGDAMDEGVIWQRGKVRLQGAWVKVPRDSPQSAFRRVWDRLYGDGYKVGGAGFWWENRRLYPEADIRLWNMNPLVWVFDFKEV